MSSSAVTVMPIAGLHRFQSNGPKVAGPGPKQGLKPHRILTGTVRTRVEPMAPQPEGLKEAVISAVSPEDTLEEEFAARDHREEDSAASDAGRPEAVVSEVHPAMAAGGRWAGGLEAEGFMAEAPAGVAVEVMAEAPGDRSKSGIESTGGGS
jgi:hypothetical protein